MLPPRGSILLCVSLRSACYIWVFKLDVSIRAIYRAAAVGQMPIVLTINFDNSPLLHSAAEIYLREICVVRNCHKFNICYSPGQSQALKAYASDGKPFGQTCYRCFDNDLC